MRFHLLAIVIVLSAMPLLSPAGEKADDPLTMYLSDICTIPCNLAGIPGISGSPRTPSTGSSPTGSRSGRVRCPRSPRTTPSGARTCVRVSTC